MTVRISIVAVLLVVASGWIAPSPAFAQVGRLVTVGRSCTPAIERITSDLTDFQQEAQNQHLDLVTGDTTSVGGAGLTWGPDDWVKPTLSGAAKVQKYRDTMGRWVDRVQYYRKVVTELQTCTVANPAPPLTPDANGAVPLGGAGLTWENCVRTLSTRFEPVARRYAEFLQKQPTQAAMSRVRTASSFVQSYAAKLGTPTSGALGDACSCMDDYQQRAEQQAQQSANASNPPAQPAPSKSAAKNAAKGGGEPSATSLAVAGGAIGATALAGAVVKANKEAEESASQTSTTTVNCSSQEAAAMNWLTSLQNAANSVAACGTNLTCMISRTDAMKSTWNSAASAFGTWCSCTGTKYSVDASTKQAIQYLWSVAPSLGLNPGTMPSCFR